MNASRKNAIVTGAGSGLGRALAVRLARDCWNIALCDINDAATAETRDLVRSAGGEAQVEHLDVSQPAEWQALHDRLRGVWRQLDLLANNAGVTGIGEVGRFTLADWRWLMDINLSSAIYGCHTFVEWLKENPSGAHIINTASTAAFESAPGTAAYNVSKAGILSLSESLYTELLPHRVGVTAVCPSFFRSNILRDARFASEQWKGIFEGAMGQTAMTADYVADQAVRGMQRGKLYVVLPLGARTNWRLKRLAPQWLLRRVANFVHAMGKSAQGTPPAAEQASIHAP